MLFVAIFLAGAGYTLVYASVKGDKYTIGGVPVWRQPWLPLVNALAGGALGAGMNPNAPGLAGAIAGAAGGTQTTAQQAPAIAAGGAGAGAAAGAPVAKVGSSILGLVNS